MPDKEDEKKKKKEDEHPLKHLQWIMYALIAVSLIGAVLSPVLGTIAKLWPIWILLVLGIITLLLIKFGGKQVQDILKMPFVTKLGKGLAVAGIIWAIATFIYSMTTDWLVINWGISQRAAWILLTVFLPISVGGFWLIFKDILPGDPKTIRRGFFSVSIVVIGILAYSIYVNPNEFFSHTEEENGRGKTRFWVSDTEEKIYFSPGYGIEDGKKLRPGTAGDAKKYSKDWWQDIKRLFKKSKPSTPSAKQMQVQTQAQARKLKWSFCSEKYWDKSDKEMQCTDAYVKIDKNSLYFTYSNPWNKNEKEYGKFNGSSSDGKTYTGRYQRPGSSYNFKFTKINHTLFEGQEWGSPYGKIRLQLIRSPIL